MVRNLFILSLLSLVVAGCMGPKKGPSAVTDGGVDTGLVTTGLTPVNTAPAPASTLVPDAAPVAPAKKAPAKSKGTLPIKNAGDK